MDNLNIKSSDYNCRSSLSNHCIGYVKSPKSATCFAMCLELPILWEFILCHHETIFLKNYLCNCVEIEMCSVYDKFLLPDYSSLAARWGLHCHCTDRQTLQCFAARRVIKALVKEVLKGTMYNQMFWDYRQFVNRGLPDTLLFVGSYYVRRVHFIVIKVILDKDVEKIRKLQFGEAAYINGLYSNFIVLICRSCNLTEIQAKICARRTRKFLLKALKCCSGPKVASKKEAQRQKDLIRLFKFGSALTQKYVKYL
ncbi:E4 ORFD [Ovine mastadenovirus A]|uniref:E4 ORFD n=1 Tax=Ovine mastadenovirus A TaxID=114424 RepID=UPI0000161E6F|nr:E4 ORFD [Ovine mastadenovirus A]